MNLRNDTREHIVTATRQFFANKIDNVSFSTKQLFSVSDQPLRKSKPVTYPTNIPKNELPEQFSQYFSDKISNLCFGFTRTNANKEL